ncbi:hypothetical protein [Lignipirellula cremea]|uniref:Uncharacterized protein n=1 Tax=Lignipirellula cremea TaxID=2528010 RepID=A0A518DNK0_9BACT|nr:hypothetical protein [Lignipirellula cremea]QDU93412.1 hypothetical protein Pla8534_11920 [Lignipirellula cremea]
MKRWLIALALLVGTAGLTGSAVAGPHGVPGTQGPTGNEAPFRGWLWRGEYAHDFPTVPHRYPFSYYNGHGNPSFGHSYWSPFYRGPGRTYSRGYSGAWKYSF